VDFGTAKDLLQPDLNGPEFVGTAEYMSPHAVRSRPAAVEADLWGLGVVLHQLWFGCTPCAASSPKLTVLKIKDANLRVSASFLVFLIILMYLSVSS
jgi:serine/threonine protein kinase